MKKHLFIGGEWVEAGEYRPLFSPYSGEQIAEVAYADAAEVDKAIEAAARARPLMANMPAHERAAILERLSSLIQGKAEECARLIALEAAKPIKDGKA